MTLEERSCEHIDDRLRLYGRLAQDRAQIEIFAEAVVAIREFPLLGGEEADYLLNIDGQANGIVEAKTEGHTLIGVEKQSVMCLYSLPPKVSTYSRLLHISYESTGRDARLTNIMQPEPRNREIYTFHWAAELLEPAKQLCQARAIVSALCHREAC